MTKLKIYIFIAIHGLWFSCMPAYAGATLKCEENITVTNNMDSGPGSFRAAVSNLCANGAIYFDNNYLITVDSTIMIDTDILIIDGVGGQIFESSGSHAVFEVSEDTLRVQMHEVTIQNSITTTGAIINRGFLSIIDSYFNNNQNTSETGGGAITNLGDLNISRVSFYRNNAAQGGAVHSSVGGLFVSNSTFYENGNLHTEQGGAIYNGAQMELINVTIANSGNGTMVEGNSLYNTFDGDFVRLVNTVITNINSSTSECFTVDEIEFPDGNYSLINDGSCNSPLTGDPLIGSWDNFGGYGPTLEVMANSPLINAGAYHFCIPPQYIVDQLLNPRIAGTNCDIGAVEFIDETFPQVSAVKVSDQPLQFCDNVKDEISQLSVTFSEPVLNAEDQANYQLLHAGDDQRFLTADDFYIDVISAVSDSVRPMPTITLQTSAVIPNGLLRLFVDSEIVDEFQHELYAGDDYQHPFRVDVGNVFIGGHIDDCVGQDPLSHWTINASNAVSLGPDKDGSNASFSLLTEINNSDDLILSQCVELNENVTLAMSLWMRDLLLTGENQQATNSTSGVSFSLTMSCALMDDTSCSGNQLDLVEIQDSIPTSVHEWRLIDADLGLSDPSILSAQCGLNIIADQAADSRIEIDALRLTAIPDLIFSNSFETQ
ncbi:MAG: choice-of-anchor Q domain-containing protein [Marinicella sp.]